ncbi:MAG TPA: hypothetical protein VGH38_35140 [Bryobacteraceae bacterium]
MPALREESECYKSLGLTWAGFCQQYVGVSRVTMDEMIHSLNTVGKGYFRLHEVMRISPKIYRAIQPAVHGESLDIEGELVPITPENSARIRAAVIKIAQSSKPPVSLPAFTVETPSSPRNVA